MSASRSDSGESPRINSSRNGGRSSSRSSERGSSSSEDRSSHDVASEGPLGGVTGEE
jgi:hypothetical protein